MREKMKKVMRLLSVQLLALLSDTLSIGKNRKKKPAFIYGGVLFFVLLLGAVSFTYSMLIGSGLKMYGCAEIMPGMMMAVTCIIILITTVFKVKGTIFGFRDYDMVMSLPISTTAIAISRLILLYVLNFLFVVIIIIPMMIAYGILMRPGIMFYLMGGISMLFIPLVPIVAASFLGAAIAYAASKFKHSNLFSILFSAGFLVLIMLFSFSFNNDGQKLAKMSKEITSKINKMYPLAGLYTDAVIQSDILAFLLFLGISAAAFLLYTVVVKTVFKKLNTIIMTGSYHTNYKLGRLRASSSFQALYRKELRRFFGSTLYCINTGLGIVMLTLGAVALIFVDPYKAVGNAEAAKTIVNMLPVYVSFCMVMTCTTMVCISLEGKSLWIMKSLPISPKLVYLSKIAVNLTIAAPAVIDVIIIGAALKMGFFKTLLLLLLTVACAVFTAFYGLLINLLLPNFNWTSETVVIKNSASTMVTVFSSMAYVALMFVFIIVLPSITAAYLCYFTLTVVLDILLFAILMTYGKKRYNFLQ
jgi:hypothetical protein